MESGPRRHNIFRISSVADAVTDITGHVQSIITAGEDTVSAVFSIARVHDDFIAVMTDLVTSEELPTPDLVLAALKQWGHVIALNLVAVIVLLADDPVSLHVWEAGAVTSRLITATAVRVVSPPWEAVALLSDCFGIGSDT